MLDPFRFTVLLGDAVSPERLDTGSYIHIFVAERFT